MLKASHRDNKQQIVLVAGKMAALAENPRSSLSNSQLYPTSGTLMPFSTL